MFTHVSEAESRRKLPRRANVLYICRRNYSSTLIEAVLSRCGAILPAATLSEAMSRLSRADVVVLSSSWTNEEKHRLMGTLRQCSKVKMICLCDAAAHLCGCCNEVSDNDAAGLEAALAQALQSRPADSDK